MVVCVYFRITRHIIQCKFYQTIRGCDSFTGVSNFDSLSQAIHEL